MEIRAATEEIRRGIASRDTGGEEKCTSGISEMDAIAGGGVLGLESLKP